MTPEQVEAHDKPVALLRPRPSARLVALLRPLPVRERTTILAQAVHEGTMTRVGADQVLFALAFDGKPGDTCSIAPCSRRQAQRNTSANPPTVSLSIRPTLMWTGLAGTPEARTLRWVMAASGSSRWTTLTLRSGVRLATNCADPGLALAEVSL